MIETEFLIVGGGIVGLTFARELIQQGADKVVILEKEAHLGVHSSGRNSGVLHAGIYYPPGTLKAQLCLKGNLLMQKYCEQKGLPLMKTGKVIVAKDESEYPTLLTLYERAKTNGAKVDLVDENELAELEPNAKTYRKALYSHYTTMVDSQVILAALKDELLQTGRVSFQLNTAMLGLADDFTANTTQGPVRFKQFINTAGAYADKIAHHFGVGKEYYLVPFKGIYYKLIKDKSDLVKGNIYPVPNLGNPFLGVHFTRSIHGDVYLGPTAIPAFGRENYGFLSGIDKELLKIISSQALLFFSNSEFRKVALEEPKKYFARYFFNDARNLVKELQPSWLSRTSKVGIRPQLVDTRNKKLLMDFLVVKDNHSLHILNAISPAFTSSMAFAKYVIEEKLNK